MNHPTLEELHDMAYGFSPADAHCEECDATLRAIEAEREFFRDALRSPAPSRVSRWIPVAAAAALVLALGFSLLPRKLGTAGTLGGAQEKPFGLDDLVREAASSDATRARIAKKALRSYGGAAIPALRKAGQDKFADELADGGNDPDLRARLRSTRISLSFSDASLSDVAGFLTDFAGINVLIDPGFDPKITLDLSDETVEEAVAAIAHQAGGYYVLVDGVVRFQKNAPGAAGFLPVRLPSSGDFAATIAKLDDDSIEARDAAAKTLADAGFGAERALWDGLASKNDAVRASCVAALEKLYERRVGLAFDNAVALETLRATKITMEYPNAPLPDVLEAVAQRSKVAIVSDAEIDWSQERVSIKVSEIVADGALLLILGPKDYGFVAMGNSIFVSKKDRLPIRTRARPQATLWLPEQHDALVSLLESADAVKLSKLGIEDVAAIRWAQGRVDPKTAEQLESAIQEILAKSERWSPDERVPIAKLANRVKLDLQEAPLDEILKELSAAAGMPIRVAKDAPMPKTFWIQAESISVAEALDFMTLPYGCVAVEVDGAFEIRRR